MHDDHCTCGTNPAGGRRPNPWCPIPTHGSELPRIPGPDDLFTTDHDTTDE